MPHGSTDPLGPVLITARDVYDAVVRVDGTLSRLVDQVAALAQDVVDHEERLRKIEGARPGERLGQLEERVRTVEGRLFPLPVLAVLFAAASLVVTLVTVGGTTT